MTKEKLLAIMESAQLSRDDISAITGKSGRQTYAWTTGAAPVPRALALVLLAIEDQKISLTWLAAAIRGVGK
jgi:hypothetical protein